MTIGARATAPQHHRGEPSALNDTRSGNSFLRSYDYPVYGVLTGVRLIVLGYAIFWFASHLSEVRFIPIALLSVPLLLPCIFDQLSWFSLIAALRTESRRAQKGLRVAAVTTFEPQSESFEMLEKSLTSLTAIAYEHDTWVLDEGDEPRVRELCRRLGAHHFSRRGDPRFQSDKGKFESGSKHGNYNAWLETLGFEQYDFIATFDPDHIPQPQFLDAVLGHFDDARVGYVQAAQAYSNQAASFVAQGAAEETYGYYSIVQAAASRYGYPVVTGCHTTHRISALQKIDGFAPHPADDVLITSNYHRAGWRGVYLPEILARGIVPVSWRSYVDQQRRWARSVLDLKLRHSISARPAHAMIQALQGVRYFLDGLFAISLILLIMLLLAGAPGALPALGLMAEVCGILFLTNLYKQRFYLDPTTECGIPWRAYLLRLVKFPYTLAALFDVIRNRQFQVWHDSQRWYLGAAADSHATSARGGFRARVSLGNQFIYRTHCQSGSASSGCLGRGSSSGRRGHRAHPLSSGIRSSRITTGTSMPDTKRRRTVDRVRAVDLLPALASASGEGNSGFDGFGASSDERRLHLRPLSYW